VRSFVSLCKNVRTSLLSIVSEAQMYKRLKRLLQVRLFVSLCKTVRTSLLSIVSEAQMYQ